ncbi:hypothetical protein KI688_010555 [Linnemannia hyalina]|uniref:Uncharacterized protein n=1 Tax=Linnemannia hyalina TaxID=64524 RepID=A0A9P8BTJ0_9FUNG|nr:hypothetical protein KI688_010555 [Linnemannia hyalina]
MRFKVKYSRLTVPIGSRYRSERTLMKAKIPRSPLWKCLPTTWDIITKSCIQNYFASAPTTLVHMREALKTAAKNRPNDELEQLKAELCLISGSASARLGSPTIHFDKLTDFLPNYNHDVTVEDDSCNDYSDDDYDPPQVIPEEASLSQRSMSHRSGQYTITAPEELPSSQEAASLQEPTSSQDFSSVDRDQEIS